MSILQMAMVRLSSLSKASPRFRVKAENTTEDGQSLGLILRQYFIPSGYNTV